MYDRDINLVKKSLNYHSLILKDDSSKNYLPLKHKICTHLPDTHVQLNLLNFVEICQVAIIPIRIKFHRKQAMSSEGSTFNTATYSRI